MPAEASHIVPPISNHQSNKMPPANARATQSNGLESAKHSCFDGAVPICGRAVMASRTPAGLGDGSGAPLVERVSALVAMIVVDILEPL
jgi:hypothetical protein